MDKTKAEFRSVSLRLGFALLLEFALMMLLGYNSYGIISLILGRNPSELEYDVFRIGIYLFSFMFPVLFFKLISLKKRSEPMSLGVKMSKESFWVIPIGLATVGAFGLINSYFFYWVDFSKLFADSELTSAPETVMDFISTAVVPAVAEEFLFRGCVLGNLKPYGKQQAIFISALTFALMHGNFRQFLFAFAVGIVLGYVYTETGSIWTCMFIHMFNNFLSTIATVLDNGSDDYFITLTQLLLESVIMLSGIVCLCVLIVRKKGKLLKENPDEEIVKPISGLGQFCKTPTFILFAAAAVIRGTYYLYLAMVL